MLTAKVGKPLEKFTWDTTVARRNPLMVVLINLTDSEMFEAIYQVSSSVQSRTATRVKSRSEGT